jgi:dTDP-L-rhamnose 4-epimerase
MKVLVTGAAGFIGSHVVDALIAKGDEVIGLDSLDPGVHRALPGYLNPRAEYCVADLRSWRPDERFSSVQAVVHLAALGGVSRAAREPANIVEANCAGTARLAEAASRWPALKRIVLGSSFSVYGSNYRYRCSRCGCESYGRRDLVNLERGIFEVLCPRCGSPSDILPITEDALPSPLETYGASKYMQELCFRGFSKCDVCVLRFSSVYGPRLRLDDGEATIIARLAGWIRSGVRPRLFEDGLQVRDWVYVGDVVEAIVRALHAQSAPAATNLCSGVPVRLIDACGYIARAIGVSCVPEVVGGYRAGDMRHCLGNATRFSELIGRQPLALQEGATKAFRENGHSVSLATGISAGAVAD